MNSKQETKFGVFNNDKPASREGFPELKGEGWDTHLFGTFEEASDYAREWLGSRAGEGRLFKLWVPIYYNGYGDTIVIREIVGQEV
ncbi:MAG: hypothetical protein AAB649_01660 [Patescibacteria group bacterium]